MISLKKFIALSLVLISIFSMNCNLYSFAIEKDDVNTTNSFVSDYRKYINQFSDFSFSSDTITLSDSLNQDGALLGKKGDMISFSFIVNEDSVYQPEIEYLAVEKTGGDINMTLLVDGKSPSVEFENFKLTRLWENVDSKIISDEFGNEFSPEQKEVFEWQQSYVRDSFGFQSEALLIGLKKGEHTISLVLSSEAVKIKNINLLTPEKINKYDESLVLSDNDYKGVPIIIEGEDAIRKSSSLIVPKTDRSDATVFPANPYKDKINFIGGSNWKSIGDTIYWEVDVPESANYNLTFHFKQTYIQDGISYRKLLIDGKCPFEEVKNISFEYDTGWQYLSLYDINKSSIYLEKGKHTIALTITLGSMSDFASSLKELTSEIGELYRKIVMITGEKPDANRDYNLFVQLPELEDKLDNIRNRLYSLADESARISGSKGGQSSANLRKAAVVIDNMLETKYKAHTRVSALYDNYTSLSSWLYEMQDMALDLDAMFLTKPGITYKRDVNFFEKVKYSFSRLLSSFVEDYAFISNSEKSVTVWCNWGRDHVSVLESLINSSFKPGKGIDVDLKITTASVIQANLSGNGPDLMMNVSRSAPVNYAIRSAAYDISKFDDYEQVIKRFSSSAMTPYKYKDGVYALPGTQSFYMLFVRTDIFDELGISIPKTWDDFIKVSKIIYLNNMQVAIPYTQVSNDAVNAGVGALTLLPTIAIQNGVNLYNDEGNKTNFDTPEMLKAATEWTDFYTKYKFPKTYNFFNRFRTGTIPMAIQDFTVYATISAAAPEIKGSWVMTQIPGVLNEDGTIDNSVSGSGGASVILSSSKNKDNAWEFLKWFTSEDIQYRFSKNLEAVLGVAGRRPTANVDALMRLGWEDSFKEELIQQQSKVKEIPEIPGSYYVSRSIDQIYWNVTAGENVRDMLKKWGKEADNEIERKIEEYNLVD